MSTSCPGFLDQYGVWNNGFDCALPRICCGTEIDRYCCLPLTSSTPSSSSSSLSTLANPSVVDLDLQNSFDFLPDRWFFFQLFIFSLFLAITILIFVMIYQCLASMRRERIRQNKSISTVQIPLPAASPLLIENHRETSKRISTISSAPSDTKSRCTETSIVLNTPLNLYPTSYSRSSASSYFIYPSDYEQLCK